jgi:hypothetical protein
LQEIDKILSETQKSVQEKMFDEFEAKFIFRLKFCSQYAKEKILTIEEQAKMKKDMGKFYKPQEELTTQKHVCPKKNDSLHAGKHGTILNIPAQNFEKCVGMCSMFGAREFCLGERK